MLASARSKVPSPVRSTQHRSGINDNVYVGRFGACIHPFEYAGPVWGTSSVLADLVESMADWDIACPDQARLGFGLNQPVDGRSGQSLFSEIGVSGEASTLASRSRFAIRRVSRSTSSPASSSVKSRSTS